MQVSPSIFKAYDIRGVVPATITPDVARALGRAFGSRAMQLGSKTVAVGRDGRLSGAELAAALMAGLVEAGVQVIDIGMATTPMLYFAAHTLCDSGIQVTGSHNPKDHNGFKMVLQGRAIYGDEIQDLHHCIEAENWQLQAGGSVRQADVLADYQQRITSTTQLARPMKIALDSGNGVAGASAPGILRALGCEVVELFSAVDGNFPNHHPDPSKPENLRDVIAALQATVQRLCAELGVELVQRCLPSLCRRHPFCLAHRSAVTGHQPRPSRRAATWSRSSSTALRCSPASANCFAWERRSTMMRGTSGSGRTGSVTAGTRA